MSPQTTSYQLNVYGEPEQERFSFGLTEFQVQRLQKILTRLEGKEVEMSAAWGRACELMALAHVMMDVLLKSEATATNNAMLVGE